MVDVNKDDYKKRKEKKEKWKILLCDEIMQKIPFLKKKHHRDISIIYLNQII